MIYLVLIQDKELYGEPDIALGIVDVTDDLEAQRAAADVIGDLADRGCGRCIPHVREIDLGRFYRLGSVVRLPPRDSDEPLPPLQIEELAAKLYEEWVQQEPLSPADLSSWRQLPPTSHTKEQWLAVARTAAVLRAAS